VGGQVGIIHAVLLIIHAAWCVAQSASANSPVYVNILRVDKQVEVVNKSVLNYLNDFT